MWGAVVTGDAQQCCATAQVCLNACMRGWQIVARMPRLACCALDNLGTFSRCLSVVCLFGMLHT